MKTAEGPTRAPAFAWAPAPWREILQIVIAFGAVGGVTSLGLLLLGREDTPNVLLAHLFVIGGISIWLGYRPAIAAAIASALSFDYFFLVPYGSFAIASGREILTFAGMFATAVFVSSLHERWRKQVRMARQSEHRMESLYALARELADAASVESLCAKAAGQIEIAANASVCVLVREGESFTRAFRPGGATALETEDLGAAAWSAAHLEPAGASTRNHPACSAMYVPLVSARGCVGVMSFRWQETERSATVRPSSLILSMGRHVALALERTLLAEEKRRAIVEVETERVRSAVLSSVSHDLRAPLAVIGSASSALVEHGDRLQASARAEMARIINDEARRLNELLRSLLDVTRLQAGGLELKREWESLEEVIGSVLRRVDERSVHRHLRVNVPSDLPLVQIDAILIEQVLLNLVDNAFKHSSSEEPVEIAAATRDGKALVSVIDHGRGVRGGELGRIFDKFYRNSGSTSGGLGLGLTIARGIVEAHGGRIEALHTPGGGLTIQFTLPLNGSPPHLAGADLLEGSSSAGPA